MQYKLFVIANMYAYINVHIYYSDEEINLENESNNAMDLQAAFLGCTCVLVCCTKHGNWTPLTSEIVLPGALPASRELKGRCALAVFQSPLELRR